MSITHPTLHTLAPAAARPAAGESPFDREPLPLDRLLRAYLLEAKLETLGALRTTGFALPFIAVPVAIYVLFGVVINSNAGSHSEFGPGIANYLFCGFAVLAAVMPGIFSGVILAQEREGNLLKLKRALPQPPGATIAAKVLMAMGVAALAVTLVALAALAAGKLTISLGQVAAIWAVLIVEQFSFIPPALAAAVLVGETVLFGGLAIRRLARVG